VLAATSQQVETIATAKCLGYQVLTVDNRPDNPGHRLSDANYNADTTDREAVLEIARNERIDGIISPCTDVAVPTAAYVAREMGLNGPPLESTRIACSKSEFRRFLRRHGMPVPAFIPFTHGFDPGGSIFQNRRWIMKPDESSGSKGIFIVGSRAEFLERSPATLAFSVNSSGILEQFIDGFQGTCEGFLKRGRMVFRCVLDRQTAAPPYGTTAGHSIPTRLKQELQQELLGRLDQVWRLLGITDGPFDSDFVATESDIFLLELSPRLGGNWISPLLKTALGVNLVEHSLRYAVNEDSIIPAETKIIPAAVVIFGVAEDGVLEFDRAKAEELSSEPWIREFSLETDWGAPVEAFVNSRNRLGHAIVVGTDRDELDARVREISMGLRLKAIP
jgi:biotin carboxylase